jgi:hypothetical protein
MAAPAPAPFHPPAQHELQQQLLLAADAHKGLAADQGIGSRAPAAAHQRFEKRVCAAALNGWATGTQVIGR